MPADITELGRALWTARLEGGLLPKSAFDGIADRARAYALQDAAAEAAGLDRAGWKIAATSGLAQELIGVPGPTLGPVFADHVFESPARLPARPEQAQAVECEIAFEIAADLDGAAAPTRGDVLAATAAARIAIEVVGCRVEGGVKGAGEVRLIGDFSFNAALVLGAAIDGWRDIDMAAISATVVVDGAPANSGSGAAVLGDPVAALTWAAGEAAGIGRPLRAGDVITTGTMTGVTPVRPGQGVVGDFGPLGTVEIAFTD